MELANTLLLSLNDLLTFKIMAFMAMGVVCGLIAGSIPGFTITMAVVLTLPFTFGMSPVQGLSTMLGVYVGGLTGGMFSAALMGIPGTPSAISTTFDAFPMSRQGRPGLALGLGLWSSFLGGIISSVLLLIMAPSLAAIGLEFGPWDYFMLVIFALTIAASLSEGDLVKGLIAGVFGLLFASVGVDNINGAKRLTFGIEELDSGFSFLPVLIGLFAFSQLLKDMNDVKGSRKPMMQGPRNVVRLEHLAALKAIAIRKISVLRAAAIGIFIGLLPAAGSSISNILAYDQEKKASLHPEKFGTGIPEGIIASETANNATAGGALITMMALGIPGDAVTAVMLGALTIHNIAPSPTFISTEPRLAYALMLAYLLANLWMLFLTSASLRVFLWITRVPLYILGVVILMYCAMGVFTLNNSVTDIWTLLLFGVLGLVMQRFGFPLTPMVLGVVLGPIAETNLSRAISTNDDWSLFLTRPWSQFFWVMAIFSVLYTIHQNLQRQGSKGLPYLGAALMASLALPLLRMDDPIRLGAGVLLVLLALRSGWRVLHNSKESS